MSSAGIPASASLLTISDFVTRRASPGLGAYPRETAARESDFGNGIREPSMMFSVSIVTSIGIETIDSKSRIAIKALPHQIVDLRQHVVCDANCPGVHFISTLRHDHVHHFLDDADIRVFEKSLVDVSQTVFSGCRSCRGAGSRR